MKSKPQKERSTAGNTVKAEGGRGKDAQPAYYLAYVCEECPLTCYYIMACNRKNWLAIENNRCPMGLLPHWKRLARKTDNAVAILQKRYRKENL